jgi:uncharacterized coiled-coil DUF342 family protein
MNIFCTVMLLGMLGITPLCYGETTTDKKSMEEVKKQTQDLLRTLGAYSVEQRDELMLKTKTALDNLDKRIDTLEKRVDKGWDKMDTAAREKARASLKELRSQRKQVAERYDTLKNSTGDAWEHVKKKFSDAYKNLSDAWEKSEKEFGSNK